jgi:hypothetical protein
MIIQAITTGIISACAIIPGCQPPLPPCTETVITVFGFEATPDCDLDGTQELRVFDEHPAPWSSLEADTFFALCADAGGRVTDADGDAWVCSDRDY